MRPTVEHDLTRPTWYEIDITHDIDVGDQRHLGTACTLVVRLPDLDALCARFGRTAEMLSNLIVTGVKVEQME